MSGFATGFNHHHLTTPGFWLQNSKYKVQFQGIKTDDADDVVELAQVEFSKSSPSSLTWSS